MKATNAPSFSQEVRGPALDELQDKTNSSTNCVLRYHLKESQLVRPARSQIHIGLTDALQAIIVNNHSYTLIFQCIYGHGTTYQTHL